MALWGARFKKELNSQVNDFNSSIKFDSIFYKEDIQGSIAHVTMLGNQNIIGEDDAKIIKEELIKIENDIESGKLKIDFEAEDIHMFIEAELTKRIGDVGKKLHTSRSRNDQVTLDLKLYLRNEIDILIEKILKLVLAICNKAEENLNTVMPGYTHMQRAQPITFAHHLMAYSEMFLRDLERIKDARKRMNIMPLGSCALAGTTYPIDRNFVKKLLGFDDITINSIDGVSDRDYVIELTSAISIIMMHLSRISEEIILWASWEFKFVELDDAFSTGSSIMPQKKNPDITELIRGKTGRVYGDLIGLLTLMKGLPLAYNKDMQEDKEAIFDALETVKICIDTFIPMLETVKVISKNMREAANKGFINATDCADYLVKKGIPFRDAYKITGKLVSYCIDNNKVLETLKLDEYKNVCDLFENDMYEEISLENCVKKRRVIGGPAPEIVFEHIKQVKNKLNVG
ncbi:MAG: argininosuccinate lyase [Clostridia bacterium]